MKEIITIIPLTPERTEAFFDYLNDHISDNGAKNTPLFLPISRENLSLQKELISSFKNGQIIPLNEIGWRRIFIAELNNEIIGHIDLKSHNQKHSNHRAIMGMGVHRDYRKIGLGCMLIEAIFNWSKNESEIKYIDLWVLSENKGAIRLYQKMGFEQTGLVQDMFRIDGESLDYVNMTKSLN